MFCDGWMDCCNLKKNVVCERKPQCDRAHVEGVLLGERELKKGEGRGSLWGQGQQKRETERKGERGKGRREGKRQTAERERKGGWEGGREEGRERERDGR